MLSQPLAVARSPEDQVKDLEKFAVAGDIVGMAKCIEQLRAGWSGLDGAMQTDIRKLEAIFMSLVQLKTGAKK